MRLFASRKEGQPFSGIVNFQFEAVHEYTTRQKPTYDEYSVNYIGRVIFCLGCYRLYIGFFLYREYDYDVKDKQRRSVTRVLSCEPEFRIKYIANDVQ